MDETLRRRLKQIAHNEAHGITPRTIIKQVKDLIDGVYSEKAGQGAERLEQAALQKGMQEKSKEFIEKGAEVYSKA